MVNYKNADIWKLVPMIQINNIPALVPTMARRRSGNYILATDYQTFHQHTKPLMV